MVLVGASLAVMVVIVIHCNGCNTENSTHYTMPVKLCYLAQADLACESLGIAMGPPPISAISLPTPPLGGECAIVKTTAEPMRGVTWIKPLGDSIGGGQAMRSF
jgi:hypothetical protein